MYGQVNKSSLLLVACWEAKFLSVSNLIVLKIDHCYRFLSLVIIEMKIFIIVRKMEDKSFMYLN